MKKLLIIDAHALIHRAYHALPPLTNKDGQPLNAVYGFLLIVMSALKDIRPDYVVVCFDSKEATFRHEKFEAYKANRAETPDDLISQFPLVQNVVDAFGFTKFVEPGFEADDLIGTVTCAVSEKYKADEVRSIVLTGDMDMLQLVNEQTRVLRLRKGVKDMEIFDEAHMQEVLGFGPKQMIEYKGLRGDASDNIPGVKGVGEKTATELIQKYGTIENIYDHLDEISGRAFKALDGHKDDAIFSRDLATIHCEVPVKFDLEEAKIGQYKEQQIMNLFREYEFKSLLTQLHHLPGFTKKEGLFAEEEHKERKTTKLEDRKPALPPKESKVAAEHVGDASEWLASAETAAAKKPQAEYITLSTDKEIEAVIRTIPKNAMVAIDTETSDLDPIQADLVGVSFSFEENTGFYVPCYIKGKVIVPKALKAFLEDAAVQKTGHNIKFDIEALHGAGVNLAGTAFDTMLASYLLSAGTRGHSLSDLAFTEFGYQMQPIEELIGKGKNQISMADVEIERVSWYAAEDADYALRLYHALAPRLHKDGLDKLLQEMELPTMLTLVDVEEAGVKIDVEFLHKMGKELHKRIAILDREIQELAGTQFNVASSVQLKGILFEVLKLPTDKIKKTKTGYSTAAPELEKLQGTHPIIDKISEFRELSKLTSTYIDTLPKLINPRTGRIHTNYNQTVAATGRLSSQDPNLQNIPIRTELGKEIRKAFIADKGKVIVACDYSQIELRVVAHLSQDPVMLEAFKQSEDIHRATAAELNDVEIEEVSSDMRRAAKAINFGILYGMGVQGIMRDSGITRDEARHFLDKYFSVHKGIHEYIEKIKTDTKTHGYAETLFGRRRHLPEINSRNRMLQAGAERAAVNMPVQGTAADIMKLAMIAVHEAIVTGKVSATMLMQVHDELVFEIDEKIAEKEAKKIREIMQNVYALDVPLVVDAEVGKNWGELSDI